MEIERAIDQERAARKRGMRPCCVADIGLLLGRYEPCGKWVPCWEHIDLGDLAAETKY